MKSIDKLRAWWDGLSQRERTYLLVLVLVVFVMGTFGLIYMRADAISKTDAKIAKVKKALDKIYTEGAVYEEKLRAKKAREATISTERVAFSTLLEKANAGLDDVKVSNQEEQPAVDRGDGLIKRVYEFDLLGVSLTGLTKFLSNIESQRGRIILTEGLMIRSPSGTEDRLNVDVRIATWERRESDDGDEDDEE